MDERWIGLALGSPDAVQAYQAALAQAAMVARPLDDLEQLRSSRVVALVVQPTARHATTVVRAARAAGVPVVLSEDRPTDGDAALPAPAAIASEAAAFVHRAERLSSAVAYALDTRAPARSGWQLRYLGQTRAGVVDRPIGQVVRLTSGRVTLGRGCSDGPTMPGAEVMSNSHVLFECSHAQVQACDGHSTNGTSVIRGGELRELPRGKHVPLEHGDLLVLASVYYFRLERGDGGRA